MVNPVLVWTAADYEGIDEYVSFEELASNMSWGQFWSVISEVRHVCGSGEFFVLVLSAFVPPHSTFQYCRAGLIAPQLMA